MPLRASLLVLLLLPALPVRADVRFPADSGVIDVTKAPYNAKGDGKTDDTAAVQKALDDHPNAGAIIYLPKGTFVISATLNWPKGERGGMEHKNTILQGQGKELTTIRLKDGCEGFSDPKAPKSLLWTGRKPAQRFRNAVRDLTLDTGKRNPGAIGARFMANNQGTFRDVVIRCGESGPIGLDLGYTDENGPCLIKDVEVIGFDVGIKTAFAVDSLTLERITLRGQKVAGLVNAGQCLSIRKLTSTNEVPAVVNQGPPGLLALIDSKLTGTGGANKVPAIRNAGGLFARDIETTGYGRAIESKEGKGVAESTVKEFLSHKPISLAATQATSLRLAIEETPEVPWGSLDEWTSPIQHGFDARKAIRPAKAGPKWTPPDATKAIQAALDSGKPTVYLPRGTWAVSDTLVIRKGVRRLLGCESNLTVDRAFSESKKPLFRVEGDSQDAFVLERMRGNYGPSPAVFVEHAGKRPVVMRNLIAYGTQAYRNTGGGKLFLEDVCGGQWVFGKHSVWARQFNVENHGTHVRNDGGTLWILGYKTERGGTLIESVGKAKTEVIGGFAYSTSGPKKEPMFVNTDSEVSITLRESCFNNNPFLTVIEETRDGKTRTVEKGDTPRWTNGAMILLYAGGK